MRLRGADASSTQGKEILPVFDTKMAPLGSLLLILFVEKIQKLRLGRKNDRIKY